MNDRDIAEFVAYLVERMQHLVHLAAVTDSRTMARYITAVHEDVHPRVCELSTTLAADEAPLDSARLTN